jgi:hypothetical protein
MLLGVSQTLLAQGGHGAGPPRPSTDTSIQDFKRAMAVQAAPDQVSDFQALKKNTDDARSQAHALQAQAAGASDAIGFFKPVSALKDVIDQVANDNHAFVKGFTKAQTVLLKDQIKKLSKAEAEVAKENKDLDEQLKRSKMDPKELQDLAGRLEKVLSDLQSQQLNVADEMGIPKT